MVEHENYMMKIWLHLYKFATEIVFPPYYF